MCPYALRPCAGSWFGVAGSAVTFNALPPAVYELRLSVRPTVSPAFAEVNIESQATASFEITPNKLVTLSLNPNTIRTGDGTIATITIAGLVSRRGATVYPSNSHPQVVATPASMVVPGGRPSSSLNLRADPRVFGGQVQITASLRKPIGIVALKTKLGAIIRSGRSSGD